jgi:TPR repeat protein
MIKTVEQARRLVDSANKDPAAQAEIKASAENSEIFGEFALGETFAYGYGNPQNYAQAVFWYAKAAAQGLAEAQFALGQFYKTGRGAPALPNAILEDHAESNYWYRLAANQGNYHASYNLGEMHYFGKGCLKSNIVAYALMQFAIGKLDAAKDACAEIAEKMRKNEVQLAQQLHSDMSKKEHFLIALDAYFASLKTNKQN